MRRLWILVIIVTSSVAPAQKTKAVSRLEVSKEGQQCLACHSDSTPGIVEQWRGSAHARQKVDCYGCHRANAGDPTAFDHYGLRIAVIVTPLYCARCHKAEVDQFEKSRHAGAAQFIGSLDNRLGEIVEGGPAAMNGCRQCHGSEVKYQGEGKFDFTTWPNSGIGRVNPCGTCRSFPAGAPGRS